MIIVISQFSVVICFQISIFEPLETTKAIDAIRAVSL